VIAGARVLDTALAAWVRARTGSDLLARAAFAASAAEGEGHACAALAESDAFIPLELAALRAHAWVGDGSVPTPFVLDGKGYFYTWRNWRHELRLADALRQRAAERMLPIDAACLAADVAELFGSDASEATRWQRVAVAATPGSRVFVLTGGPGTGKTETILRMLLLVLAHARACRLPEQPQIALAAPTGKAARRLARAVADGRGRLRAHLAEGSKFGPLLEAVPHGAAQTVHRLLGYRPSDNAFARAADNPIAADIVVVDEASMVDLALMRQLVDALPAHAMLILLGDPDQLAAVEAGSVLRDIVASVGENLLPGDVRARLAGVAALDPAPPEPAPLAGQVITLRHVWRAGSSLKQALEAIRAGDAGWLKNAKAEAAQGIGSFECADAAALAARVEAWCEAHAETIAELLRPGVEPEAALASLRRATILCALREGPFGTRGLNAAIERLLAERHGVDTTRTWYPGRPVLIVHNDYARGLSNGDVGVALAGRDGLRVWFETSARDGTGSLASYSPRTLPAHDTAWAITIHRSQGSEYADVAAVLPPDPEHRILSRELLYTAVSRAARRAEIWSTAAAIRAAIAKPVRRLGGLREALR